MPPHTEEVARAEGRKDGQRVLVVDDAEENRLMVRALLDQRGLANAEAADGEQALALLAEQSFDLVLLDIEMPVLDGRETIARIRADEALRPLPVLAFTGHDEEEAEQLCEQHDFDGYVRKPLEPAALYDRISAALAGERLQRAAVGATEAGAETEADFDADSLLQLAERLGVKGQQDLGPLQRIVDIFVSDSPGRIEALGAAVKNDDLKDLQYQAHSLKTGAATVGALRLAALCRQLEGQARSGQLSQGEACVSDAQASYEAAIVALEAAVQALRDGGQGA